MMSVSRMLRSLWLLVPSLACTLAVTSAGAFQIAPLGSTFEASLTNEPEASLVWWADKLGRLVKVGVHEEITQLAFGCPVENSDLRQNLTCSGKDKPFASPYVIYGVRWNDLPPFRLEEGQGQGCTKALGGGPACIQSQTVRFTTQPECWICLFKQAGDVARTSKIAKCKSGSGYARGTLMTRSHFGDLQFLHAMANEEGVSPEETREKILGWLEFAWRVVSEEYAFDRRLNTIDIPVIKEHFGCTEWTVEELYILGRGPKLRDKLSYIAFGSILHTVQDSFASGHTERAPAPLNESCPSSKASQPGRIVEFHAYGPQDSSKHDAEDKRDAMVANAVDRWPDAIEASARLFEFFDDNAPWEKVRPYVECVFALSLNSRQAGAGDFRP